MYILIIIASVLLWLLAFAALFRRMSMAPAISFAALLLLSLATRGGYQLLPLNSAIMWGWLAMTVVVTAAAALQPPAVARAANGVGYMLCGALTGMAVGLLGFTFSADISMLYGIMVVATAAGTFLGFLLYSYTPRGAGLRAGGGGRRFFRYLLAKGFPTAITVMQPGVALVLATALHNTQMQ